MNVRCNKTIILYYFIVGNEDDVGLTPRILQGLFARVDEAQENPECNISCRVDVR